MKKILIGAKRSKGVVEMEGRKNGIPYDNIVLQLAEYNHNGAMGFFVGKNGGQVKIKTANFEHVANIKPGVFLKEIEKYLYKRVRVIGEENDYGKIDIEEIRFSTRDCYQIYEDELREASESPDVSESSFGFDDDDDDDDDDDFETSGLKVNKKTGEVS